MIIIELLDEAQQLYKISHQDEGKVNPMASLFNSSVAVGTLIVLTNGDNGADLPEPVMAFILLEQRLAASEVIATRADLGFVVLKLMKELRDLQEASNELRNAWNERHTH